VLLSDRDIRAELKSGGLRIEPHDDTLIQPASVDVRLGGQFRLFPESREEIVDPEDPPEDLTTLVGCKSLALYPGEFVLGATLEAVTLPDYLAGRVEGKSTLGRLGIMLHSTAGWIDPGFTGQLTLELSNAGTLPVVLRPGMRIGQLCLMRCSSPAERPYGSPGLGSHYQGQQGPVPAAGLAQLLWELDDDEGPADAAYP
jgi:dCTP deaminase